MKQTSGVRTFLGVVLACLFVLAGASTLFVFNLARLVGDREVLRDALREPLFRDIVLDAGTLALVGSFDMEERVTAEDRRTLRGALSELLPPEWLEGFVLQSVDAAYDYLETGDLAALRIRVDLEPPLVSARGEAGRNLVRVLVAGLPKCESPSQNFDFLRGDIDAISCLPGHVLVESAVSVIHYTIIGYAEFMLEGEPVELDLVEWGDAGLAADLQDFRRNWAPVAGWVRCLPVFPFAILLLMLAVHFRDRRALGLSCGFSLVFAGGIALVTALLLSAFSLALLQFAVVSSELSASVASLFLSLGAFVGHFLELWMWPVQWQALAMALAGVGFLVWGFRSRSIVA